MTTFSGGRGGKGGYRPDYGLIFSAASGPLPVFLGYAHANGQIVHLLDEQPLSIMSNQTLDTELSPGTHGFDFRADNQVRTCQVQYIFPWLCTFT